MSSNNILDTCREPRQFIKYYRHPTFEEWIESGENDNLVIIERRTSVPVEHYDLIIRFGRTSIKMVDVICIDE